MTKLNKTSLTKLFIIAFLGINFLTACTSNSRYSQHKDTVPTRLPHAEELHDAVPKAENKSRGGNKHYSVRGQHYKVLTSAENFKEHGIASFYGEKFHGHLTSNGEVYDMYSMTAAHKNLPLPSFVKVTNLRNNKSVIVRVNDRGPFHPGRIIDLSFSAAYKLDMIKTGIANVEIETITDFTPKVEVVKTLKNNEIKVQPLINTAKIDEQTIISRELPEKIKQHYIQVFATSNIDLAKKISGKLIASHNVPVSPHQANGLYRVMMGPINSAGDRFLLIEELKRSGYKNAFSKEMFQP